jgi:hypothetical protein
MKDSEILEKCADDVSRPNGWQQGSFGDYIDPNAPVCLSGALYRHTYHDVFGVAPALVRVRLTNELMYDLRSAPRPDLRVSVEWWNDYPGRTAGEVADQFRTTAKRLRDEGR